VNKLPAENARSTNDDARTEDAKRVVDDYAKGFREMLDKLRKLFQ
jgi:hypothetical protein